MPTPLARLFGRGRPRQSGDRDHGLRLAAALAESSQPLRVLAAACRLALRTPDCDVALVGLRVERESAAPQYDWVAGGCRRCDRRLLEEALRGRHSPLPAIGEQPLWIRMGDDPFQPGAAVLRRFGLCWLLALPGRAPVDGSGRQGVVLLAGCDPHLEADHPLVRDARLVWLSVRGHLTAAASRLERRFASPWPENAAAWLQAPAPMAMVARTQVLAVNQAARQLLAETVGGDEARQQGWLLGAVRRLEVSGQTSETLTASLSRGRSLRVTVGAPLADVDARLVALHQSTASGPPAGDQEAAMRMLGHELRTPLAAMQTSLDLVLRGETGPLADNQQRFLGATRRNLERLNRLLGDLLEARHLSATSHPALAQQTVDLGALLHDELSMLSVVCREKGLTLQVDRIPQSFRACVDPDRIQQVLHNVVGNAIKYTAGGGIVRVALQEEPALAPGMGPRLACLFNLPLDIFTLVVEDTGLGMSEAFLAKLFQPFNREDRAETRSLPGAGLGLHITRGLVEAHGGLIRIESRPGHGTTVWLVLPREPQSGRVLTVGRQLAALQQRARDAGLPSTICALDLRHRLATSQPWEIEAATEQALAFLIRLGRESTCPAVAEFTRSAGTLGWPLAPGLCCGLVVDPQRLAPAWQVAAIAPESVRLLADLRWRDLDELLNHAEAAVPPLSLPPATGPEPERVGV